MIGSFFCRKEFTGVFALCPELVYKRTEIQTKKWLSRQLRYYPSLVYFIHINKRSELVLKPSLKGNRRQKTFFIEHLKIALNTGRYLLEQTSATEDVIWRDANFVFTYQFLLGSGKTRVPDESLQLRRRKMTGTRQLSFDTDDRSVRETQAFSSAKKRSPLSVDSLDELFLYEIFCVFLPVCRPGLAINWSLMLHQKIWECFYKNRVL